MHYRLYKPEDFSALYAIEEVCFKRPFRFSRRYMKKLVGASNSATWIAEDSGRFAGFAIVEWNAGLNPVSAYIQTIEVDPGQRKHGIGSALMGCVEDSARGAGASTLWLHVDVQNASAIRLYEAHGFTHYTREEDFYAPGRGALVYGKPLVTGSEV